MCEGGDTITIKMKFLYSFMLKAMIGRDAFRDTDNGLDQELLVRGCVDRAYADMMTAGRYVLVVPKKMPEDVSSRDKRCGAVFYLFKNGLGKPLSPGEDPVCALTKAVEDQIVRVWVEQCGGEVKATSNGETKFVSREKNSCSVFGLAQKLVNMAIKYIYILREMGCLPDLGRDFKFFEKFDFRSAHCPLDSIILDKYAKDVCRKVDFVWSKLTREQYECVENEIETFLNGAQKPDGIRDLFEACGKLAYDFVTW